MLKTLLKSPNRPSSAQIAYELGGITRNAVIGKVVRLGLSLPNSGSHASLGNGMTTVRAKRKPRDSRYLRYRSKVPQPVLSRVPVAPTPVARPVVISTEHMVQFMQLEPHHCRFPLWGEDSPFNEQWFCGTPTADVAGRPYCAGHDAIAYPPRTRSAWSEAAE